MIVFESSSSTVFQLPETGEAVIGRKDRVEIPLRDNAVSRRHATIVLSGGQAEIADLGSQNGTRVNGERVVGRRPLIPGDVITMAGVTLVFQTSAVPPVSRSLLELPQLRQRLDEELERSLRYQRPFSVHVANLGRKADRAQVMATLRQRIRRIDVCGWGGAEELLVLMPEMGAPAAESAAKRLLEALSSVSPEVRIGYASCPANGYEADSLLASARTAARDASPGTTLAATEVVKRMRLGEHEVVVADPVMIRVYTLLDRLAQTDLPVLIQGETGTGKELAASTLHHGSARRAGPFVAVNCAALPEQLIESELFGHERGAFTNASRAKPGRLETAHRGTLLLDEVGDLPLSAQAKLLRVLETKRVMRLGDVEEREVDIRVVAATNRDLKHEVAAGRFRQDLFFRLGAGLVWLPPLRNRKAELPHLARSFLADACARAGVAEKRISDEAMLAMVLYAWPGNVRELKNLMEYVVATVSDPVLGPEHLTERLEAPEGREDERSQVEAVEESGSRVEVAADPPSGPPQGNFRPIEDEVRQLERSRMEDALRATSGNQTRAARLVQMPLRTFQAKLRRYQIQVPNRGR